MHGRRTRTVYRKIFGGEVDIGIIAGDPIDYDPDAWFKSSAGVKAVITESISLAYEWFGQNPGHEALTAYGVLEFADMARIYDVDLEMLERTRNWLLERRGAI